MAKVNYTKEQQKVIDSRNRNLLVSAAAGSGKTAVLVERILQMIIQNEIQIDQLLVVTFTNAAASEMRERIGLALEKKIEEEPSNRFLHKQLILLPNANIMTIHAFCLKIIKNYYHTIQLDPSFRIGDETELNLLKNDIVKEVLETHYAHPKASFLHFVESFSTGKTDEIIDEVILSIDRFASSHPWPFRWLDEKVNALNFTTIEDVQNSIYYKMLLKETKDSLEVIEKKLQQVKDLCKVENGPAHYLEAVDGYIRQVDIIKEEFSKGYSAIKSSMDNFSSIRLSSKRKGFDPLLRDQAKSLLDSVKKEISLLRDTYFTQSIDQIQKDCEASYRAIQEAVELAKEFRDFFQKEKEDKNIIDFNDIEHFALKILVDDQGNPTDVAKEVRDSFHEILIDEYQDSNLVQETILCSISKEPLGTPNMFMVGDVKQSIYKFRLAKPEIFMEKYETYSELDSFYQLINLHKNFRSRKEVLGGINFIFSQVMSKELGNVTYDNKTALHLGATYDDSGESDYIPEVMIIDSKSNEDYSLTDRQIEARMIGNRIHQLLNTDFQVYDKQLGSFRKVQYKDIVILLRTTSGWVKEFSDELSKMGIPMYTDSATGYFDTLEISTIVNLLKIIDNPRQDLSLVSILRSPIVGLSAKDLVLIRKWHEGVEFYDALNNYYKGTTIKDELYEKVDRFICRLKEWREKSTYLSIDELIYLLYEETNYYYYVTLLPKGKQRKANLDIFVDRASTYEQTSYRGLFNFIRYIENMKKYEIDLGEASIFSENDNLVKIMSIHKSKGLEFPVVFVAGLGKQFNMMDLRQPLVCHQDLGFGADFVDYEKRYKFTTLPKSMIKQQIKKELLSEELRILYVALTRAKEKLILVGTINDIEKQARNWCASLYNDTKTVDHYTLHNQKSFIDWIMSALARHPDGSFIRELVEEPINVPICLSDEQSKFSFQLVQSDAIINETNHQVVEEETLLERFNEWEEQSLTSDFSNTLDWVYPYESLTTVNVTQSVSDIKRKKMLSELDDSSNYMINIRQTTPTFMLEEKQLTSAERGTAFHKVMYYLNFELIPSAINVEDFLVDLEKHKIITRSERKSIYKRAVIEFLKSPISQRMRLSERVKRETPFVLGIPVKELSDKPNMDVDEQVMIQGVIDVFFEEEDGLVLLDYKTDSIRKGQEHILVKRYKEQMYYYKRALEQITNQSVKEIILYSVSLAKGIKLLEF